MSLKVPYSYSEAADILNDISGAFGRGAETAALVLAIDLLRWCDAHRAQIEEQLGDMPIGNRETAPNHKDWNAALEGGEDC